MSASSTASRRRLPDTRPSITVKRTICGSEYYITVGFYDDPRDGPRDTPAELFIKCPHHGSVTAGLIDGLCTSMSVAWQYGVPWEVNRSKFLGTRFGQSDIHEGVEQTSFLDGLAKAIDGIILERRKVTGEDAQPRPLTPDEAKYVEGVVFDNLVAEGTARTETQYHTLSPDGKATQNYFAGIYRGVQVFTDWPEGVDSFRRIAMNDPNTYTPSNVFGPVLLALNNPGDGSLTEEDRRMEERLPAIWELKRKNSLMGKMLIRVLLHKESFLNSDVPEVSVCPEVPKEAPQNDPTDKERFENLTRYFIDKDLPEENAPYKPTGKADFKADGTVTVEVEGKHGDLHTVSFLFELRPTATKVSAK